MSKVNLKHELVTHSCLRITLEIVVWIFVTVNND